MGGEGVQGGHSLTARCWLAPCLEENAFEGAERSGERRRFLPTVRPTPHTHSCSGDERVGDCVIVVGVQIIDLLLLQQDAAVHRSARELRDRKTDRSVRGIDDVVK